MKVTCSILHPEHVGRIVFELDGSVFTSSKADAVFRELLEQMREDDGMERLAIAFIVRRFSNERDLASGRCMQYLRQYKMSTLGFWEQDSAGLTRYE